MDIESNINQSRQIFDQQLYQPAFDQVIADSEHLSALIKMMDMRPNCSYLDLATGTGYIAFELARKFPQSMVTGLDITPNAIRQNQARQQACGLNNLEFTTFDGLSFPFEEQRFFGVACRYAFHHFPDPTSTLKEIKRILLPGGFFLVSDPLTADDDHLSFIDRFQKFKPDGHVHFYQKNELKQVFLKNGFFVEKFFFSKISYPREMNPDYTRLLEATPQNIQQQYGVEIKDSQVFVTISVINILFRKLILGGTP